MYRRSSDARYARPLRLGGRFAESCCPILKWFPQKRMLADWLQRARRVPLYARPGYAGNAYVSSISIWSQRCLGPSAGRLRASHDGRTV